MGWKVYFWFTTLLLGASTGVLIADSLEILPLENEDSLLDEPWTWLDSLNIVVSWIGIVGLFGFAYKKIIGEQDFWKRWFVFTLIFDISYEVYVESLEGFTTEVIWFYILVYSLSIPYYVALYLYGYKSDSLWNPQSKSPQ